VGLGGDLLAPVVDLGGHASLDVCLGDQGVDGLAQRFAGVGDLGPDDLGVIGCGARA
jgi:hypothetical protein